MKKKLFKNIDISSLGIVRVGSAVPRLKVADVKYNEREICELIWRAASAKISILVFPELSLSGYSCADLFMQKTLQDHCLDSLQNLAAYTSDLDICVLVGLPFAVDGRLYNVAAVLANGKIQGLVPKTHLVEYREFYEKRWFTSGRDFTSDQVLVGGLEIPFGPDLLFSFNNSPVCLGVEICEDLWAPIPPSTYQAISSANLIGNLSASTERLGKAQFRRDLIKSHSARVVSAYVYSSSGVHESSSDVLFSGHALIGYNGSLVAENQRFERESSLIFSDIDIDALNYQRHINKTYADSLNESFSFRKVTFDHQAKSVDKITFYHSATPFVATDKQELEQNCKEILNIQAAALAQRLDQANIKNLVIGVSGGLDSAIALVAAVKAFAQLKLSTKNIHAFSLPALATSTRTKENAKKLALGLGVSFDEIDLSAAVLDQFKIIGHDPKNKDLTYENVQARVRTLFLMNKANQLSALVLGTGDLSEIALGWNTFAGDQISHYNVNCSIPKTLMRALALAYAEFKEFAKIKDVLVDIWGTPISPELVTNENKSLQKSEDVLGPYELHDFFLYYMLRWGTKPDKLVFYALAAFGLKYKEEEIKKHLRTFITRFFKSQWKRSVMADGPKLGPVCLSPRGDWRMPPEAEYAAWLDLV